MARLSRRLVAIAIFVVAGAGVAVAAGNEAAATSAMAAPGSASGMPVNSVAPSVKLFAGQETWLGTLGDMPMQAKLRLKTDFEGGLEGEYFLFGHSQKILLAGEFDADGIFLEESENGTDVSGQWEGKLEHDVMRGSWTSADGTVTKPFMLQPLDKPPNTQKAKPSSIVKSGAPTKADFKP
jgi:hypothetical protein